MNRAGLPGFDRSKFKELVLYIARTSEGDSTFGDIKLNKVLYFAEAFAFCATGDAITNERYQKLGLGPASRHLLPMRREMVKDGDCVVTKRDHYGMEQTVTVALRNPELSNFSAQEIAIVDDLIREFWGQSAAYVSRFSHDFIGLWDMIEEGDDVPLDAVRFSRRPLTEKEIAHGLGLAVKDVTTSST